MIHSSISSFHLSEASDMDAVAVKGISAQKRYDEKRRNSKRKREQTRKTALVIPASSDSKKRSAGYEKFGI